MTAEYSDSILNCREVLFKIALKQSSPSHIMRICVCGSFKTGKTSLLNALLGTNLPVSAVKTYPVLFKICGGNDARMYWSDRITVYTNQNELCDEILRIYQTDAALVNLMMAQIGCQSDMLCGGRVEFYDTPGFDYSQNATDIVYHTLGQCDAAVMIFDAIKFGSISEKMALLRISEIVGGRILFIVNRIDLLNSYTELCSVEKSANRLLAPYLDEDPLSPFNRILFVSSLV